MSIAVLNQVYDEARRLSIAGSNLASGDFRLKKLVEPLQKSAQKAPVFGKVAEAIEKLIASNQQTSAASLLDLTMLTTAILYTQGETGIDGALEPIASQNLGLTISNTGARVLKPLIEALTTIGSGRLEIIRDAHERGAFSDLRLIKHAIAALNDKYAEIAEFAAEKILPMYGRAIYPELREGYDPGGKGDDARRLKLLHRLDPDATRALVDAALEDGSKDVKLAAIGCLEGRADCVPFLLDQAKAKAQDIRALALRSMATIDQPNVIEALKAALAGADVWMAAPYVHKNPNRELQAFVVDEAIRQRDALLSAAGKKAAAPQAAVATGKAPAKAPKNTVPDQKELGQRFFQLLGAFQGRTDPAAVAFLLDCYARQEQFLKVNAGHVDGDEINTRIALMMLMCGAEETRARLVERGAAVTPAVLEYGFLASSLTESPQQTFARFGPAYRNRVSGRTKDAESARAIAEKISEVLASIEHQKERARRWADRNDDPTLLWSAYSKVELDPQWLDAALERNDQDVILVLANQPHPGVWKYLSNRVQAELKKKTWNPGHSMDDVIEAMIRTEHPDLVPDFVQVLTRSCASQQQFWWGYYLIRMIARMPEAAIAPLEAMVSSVQEKLLDAFVSALDELKQKHRNKE